jgi:hypothetical protein
MYLFYSEADRPLGRKLKGRGESVTEVQVFRKPAGQARFQMSFVAAA